MDTKKIIGLHIDTNALNLTVKTGAGHSAAVQGAALCKSIPHFFEMKLQAPVEGCYMTYSTTGKDIFCPLTGRSKAKVITVTSPVVLNADRGLCLRNPQGVEIPIGVFTRSRRVASYFFHDVA